MFSCIVQRSKIAHQPTVRRVFCNRFEQPQLTRLLNAKRSDGNVGTRCVRCCDRIAVLADILKVDIDVLLAMSKHLMKLLHRTH